MRSAYAALDPSADRADPRTSTRAVLSWSFECLADAAAHLFTLTAAHPGETLTIEQLADMAGLDPDVVRAQVGELVEANLLTRGRLWCHHLLLHYANELLDPGVRDTAEDRPYTHVTTRALAGPPVPSAHHVDLLRADPEDQAFFVRSAVPGVAPAQVALGQCLDVLSRAGRGRVGHVPAHLEVARRIPR